MATFSPDDALRLRAPTERFLCPVTANTFQIAFLAFQIRDIESGAMLFSVGRDVPVIGVARPPAGADAETATRCVQYQLPATFLTLKTVGTKLTFSVGPDAVEGFRMVEVHFFKGRVVKVFDFTFGFCIPRSTNTWEAIYSLPDLPPAVVAEMVASPFETKSDSFYFAAGRLIMHNKAEYAYVTAPSGPAPPVAERERGREAAGAK